MSIGISLMVHRDLDKAAILARALVEQGCKLAIHVDAKVPVEEYSAFVASLPDVDFVTRLACAWGEFSLVTAQLNTALFLLNKHADVSHVVQLSGSCLPTRPIREFQQFLGKYPDTDFIESHLAGGQNWIKDGLEFERFSLYFPYSWTTQRRRFDAFVSLQRKLKVRRKIPGGLTPHIGSQWWALTRKTILSITNDPNRPAYDKYFAKCWIPDELYFQTIARKHSDNIISRSMTFNRFDYQGKPMVFYDDHLQYLGHLSGFFIRKIWRGADRLYETLLDPTYTPGERIREKREAFQAMIAQAENRRVEGRRGLVMQSCAPKPSNQTSATQYLVLDGFDNVFNQLGVWFQDQTLVPLHGHLFAKKGGHFARGGKFFTGNQTDHPRIRNYNPVNYLLGFIWNNRLSKIAFRFRGSENRKAAGFIANDANAHVFHISDIWLFDLMQQGFTDPVTLRHKVGILAEKETEWINLLKKGAATVHFIALADVLTNPEHLLREVVKAIRPDLASAPLTSANISLPDEFPAYLRMLEDNGIDISTGFAHSGASTGQTGLVAE